MWKTTKPATFSRYVNQTVKGEYGTVPTGYQFNVAYFIQGYAALVANPELEALPGWDSAWEQTAGRDYVVPIDAIEEVTDPPPVTETIAVVFAPGDIQLNVKEGEFVGVWQNVDSKTITFRKSVG